MYMQTALNTWFWKSYLQRARGTIHRPSIHSCFTLLLHLNSGRYKFIRQYSKRLRTRDKSILRATQRNSVPQNNVSTRTAKVSNKVIVESRCPLTDVGCGGYIDRPMETRAWLLGKTSIRAVTEKYILSKK